MGKKKNLWIWLPKRNKDHDDIKRFDYQKNYCRRFVTFGFLYLLPNRQEHKQRKRAKKKIKLGQKTNLVGGTGSRS